MAPDGQRALTHFLRARAWMEQHLADDLEYFRELTLDSITREDFFGEYAHVVLASGFEVWIVQGRRQRLKRAFRDWDVEAITRNTAAVRMAALRSFNSPRKIDAIIRTAQRLATEKWESLKERLGGPRALEELRSFPYIGPTTVYHLARNIGLEYAKPDRWLITLAEVLGYGDDHQAVNDMVRDLQEATGERPGVIDIVLWEFARNFGVDRELICGGNGPNEPVGES